MFVHATDIDDDYILACSSYLFFPIVHRMHPSGVCEPQQTGSQACYPCMLRLRLVVGPYTSRACVSWGEARPLYNDNDVLVRLDELRSCTHGPRCPEAGCCERGAKYRVLVNAAAWGRGEAEGQVAAGW